MTFFVAGFVGSSGGALRSLPTYVDIYPHYLHKLGAATGMHMIPLHLYLKLWNWPNSLHDFLIESVVWLLCRRLIF